MGSDRRKGIEADHQDPRRAGEGEETVKITKVSANNRKRAFEVHTRSQSFQFPYSKLRPEPEPGDSVASVYVDPELAREGFTYSLASGEEGSVPIDAVLEYNKDPAYEAKMMLYRLTVAAKKRFEESDLSVREIARRLKTSPTQIYRLLDTTNYSKSLQNVVALLKVLGCDVDIEITDSAGRHIAI
ncbi:MAG: helix-turn-helix domain-containing protein [Actinomycetota bacterium]